MIIDFHTHIFPSFFRDDRERFFSGEPSFKRLYTPPKSKLAGRKDLLRMMDAAGIEQSVIFGFPWAKKGFYQRHNDYIIDTVDRHRDRFVGFCCFSLSADGAIQEAERCLAAGLRGVGELAVYGEGFSSKQVTELEEIMALCRRHDVPLLLHTNEPVGHEYPGKTAMDMKALYALVKAYPDNRIVLAHWGGGLFFYALMRKEVRETLKNVWYDTAASPFLYRPDIYRIAGEIVGFDRILFGSDYPLLMPARYFQEMEAAGLDEEAVTMIQGQNAAALLKMESR
jgi:predicted TIM-barrel fold metal-dependent hydrolase